MQLTLVRKEDTHECTIGRLFINGKFFCFTLEDTFRHEKIKHETRIPAGHYKIELRKEGGKYPRYQKRFGTNGMLWLKDVPDYEWVYIHAGNDEDDTSGCILVGASLSQNATRVNDEVKVKTKVLSSGDTYIDLWKKIGPEIEAGQPVYISIIDN